MSNSTDLGATIRKGSAWLFVGNTGNQILSFLVGIVLARLLAPKDFGMLITVQVFTGLAGLIAGGGMGQALVRMKEASERDYDTVFTLQIFIGGLIYAFFFFTAPWFSTWYNTPLYVELLRVSSLSFILRPFINLPNIILTRGMRFKELSVARIAILLISSSTSIAMAYSGYGVWSLIFGGIVGSVMNAFILALLTKWRPGLALDLKRGKEITRYGFLASSTDILVYLQNQTSVFMLSQTLGPSSVGLYNKGESLARMPHQFITGSVYRVLFRAMASEQENLDKCRYLYFRSISLVAVYATPFYVGLLWLAEPLVQDIYGPKWIDSATPLFILSFAWPFWLVNNLSGAVLAAKNWLDRELAVQVFTLIITVLAVLIGLSHGIKGVALGIVGGIIYSSLHMYSLAIRCLEANWMEYFRALIPATILNTILASTLYITDHLLSITLHSSDLSYVALMSISGSFVYTLCFLYLPITSLQSERDRWKMKLYLPR